MRRRAAGILEFYRVPVRFKILGKLHATPIPTREILEKKMPPEAQIEAREAAGEVIYPVEELEAEVREAVGLAVFRRDENGRIYIPAHWVKGHLKDAGEALSRPLNFWGLKDFIGRTLFATPRRIYLQPENLEVKKESWATYFEIPRLGRRTGIKEAEYVEDPEFYCALYLLADPRWNIPLLLSLLDYGSIRGFGGGRSLDLGKYRYEAGEWESLTLDQIRTRYFAEYLGTFRED